MFPFWTFFLLIEHYSHLIHSAQFWSTLRVGQNVSDFLIGNHLLEGTELIQVNLSKGGVYWKDLKGSQGIQRREDGPLWGTQARDWHDKHPGYHLSLDRWAQASASIRPQQTSTRGPSPNPGLLRAGKMQHWVYLLFSGFNLVLVGGRSYLFVRQGLGTPGTDREVDLENQPLGSMVFSWLLDCFPRFQESVHT